MFNIVRPSTENQMESPEAPKAVQGIFCSSEACGEPAVADFDARRLCMEHFLVVCFQELEARNERLKSQPCRHRNGLAPKILERKRGTGPKTL